MADLKIYGGYRTLEWRIEGLGSAWKTQYYKSAAITTSSFTNGTTTKPSYTSSVNATSSGSNLYTPWKTYSITPSSTSTTYSYYGCVCTPNGGGSGIPAYYTTNSGKAQTVKVYRNAPSTVVTLSRTARTSITATISTVDSNFTYYKYYCKDNDTNTTITYPADTDSESNYTSATSHQFTGLTVGHSYTVQVYVATNSWGRAPYANTSSTKLRKTISIPTTTFSVSAPSDTYNTIRVEIDDIDTYYKYNKVGWRISGSSGSYLYNQSTFKSMTSYDITGLDATKTYEIVVIVSTSTSSSSSYTWTLDSLTQKPNQQPSSTTRFSVTAPSSGYQNDTYSTTLTVSITTVDSNYPYNQVWYRIDGSSSSYSKTTLTTSTSITLSSLTPGEIYEINVYSSAASAAYGLPVYPSPDNAKTQITNGRATLASNGERETSITANVKLQSSSISRKITIDAYKNGTKYQSCSHPVTINSGDTASNVKVDGLEPNTTYDIYCYVEYPVGSGTYKRLGGFSATTQSLQGTLSVASNTETGVNWSVTGLSTNSGYQRIIYFDLATSSSGSNVYGNSASAAASTSSASNTCWNIPPSTGASATTLYYDCYVRFDNQVNTDGKSVQFLLKSGTYTVPYVQGSVSGTAVAETSITCQLTGLSSYPVARTISIDAIPTSGSTVNYSGTVSASTTSKTGIQITGLKKGTDYTVYAYIKFGTTYGPAGDSYYSLGSYTVRTSGANIDPWTWTAPNTYNAITRTDTIATQAQMTSADTALTNKQATTNFSFRVWNDLVYKVYEACTVAGRGWDGTYLPLNETLMSTSDSTDRILTADRYNAVRNQWSSGIAKVNKNDIIYAQAHFYDLTTSLNTWINSL